jgi:hypothetical protein
VRTLAGALVILAIAAPWSASRLTALGSRSGLWSEIYVVGAIALLAAAISAALRALGNARAAGTLLLVVLAGVLAVEWLILIVVASRAAPYEEPLETRLLALGIGNAAGIASAVLAIRAARAPGRALVVAALVATPIACIGATLMSIAWLRLSGG